MAEENPFLKETTFDTTASVGQSAPTVADPFAEELAALKQKSAELEASLRGSSSLSGSSIVPTSNVANASALNLKAAQTAKPGTAAYDWLQGHGYPIQGAAYTGPRTIYPAGYDASMARSPTTQAINAYNLRPPGSTMAAPLPVGPVTKPAYGRYTAGRTW
jgi:hypothetical protein